MRHTKLDFEIKADHLISARRPDLQTVIIINNNNNNNNNNKERTCRIVNFTVLEDHRVKLKESEKRDKYLDLARELKKKTTEHESDADTNCNWCARYSHQSIGKGTGRLGNKRRSSRLIKIGQNTVKSLRDLMKFAVTQAPVENHQLMLVLETLKGV